MQTAIRFDPMRLPPETEKLRQEVRAFAARLRRYLDSVDQYQGKGRLTTWLGRVTQNLVSDYFRERNSRRTVLRAIDRLELNSQVIVGDYGSGSEWELRPGEAFYFDTLNGADNVLEGLNLADERYIGDAEGGDKPEEEVEAPAAEEAPEVAAEPETVAEETEVEAEVDEEAEAQA